MLGSGRIGLQNEIYISASQAINLVS